MTFAMALSDNDNNDTSTTESQQSTILILKSKIKKLRAQQLKQQNQMKNLQQNLRRKTTKILKMDQIISKLSYAKQLITDAHKNN